MGFLLEGGSTHLRGEDVVVALDGAGEADARGGMAAGGGLLGTPEQGPGGHRVVAGFDCPCHGLVRPVRGLCGARGVGGAVLVKPGRGLGIAGGQDQDIGAQVRTGALEKILEHAEVLMDAVKSVPRAQEVVALDEHVPHLAQMHEDGFCLVGRHPVEVRPGGSPGVPGKERECCCAAGQEQLASVHVCAFLREERAWGEDSPMP